MNAPTLCPDCRKQGVIATMHGPTCTHQAKTGAAWFPDWWDKDHTLGEVKRVEWIKQRSK